MKTEKQLNLVIGVDGGGSKTLAVLANLKKEILARAETGPSNLRNVGIKAAGANISEAILKTISGISGKNVFSIFIALAAVEEEFKSEKEKIKKEILKIPKISKALKGKIEIISDQRAGFKSGTDEKDGLVLISGAGSVCHGWRKNREVKVSGWGWLNDEGSGFWGGQRVFQAIFRELDGRGKKTLLTKLTFQRLKVKTKEDLLFKIYSENPTKIIPLLSIYCDTAAQKGDRVAKKIMVEAGKELSLAAKVVIKKLNFQKSRFPLVMVGGMFKSKIVLDTVKKEIKKVAPKVQFIQPKVEPVIGAVKLAIEKLKYGGIKS